LYLKYKMSQTASPFIKDKDDQESLITLIIKLTLSYAKALTGSQKATNEFKELLKKQSANKFYLLATQFVRVIFLYLPQVPIEAVKNLVKYVLNFFGLKLNIKFESYLINIFSNTKETIGSKIISKIISKITFKFYFEQLTYKQKVIDHYNYYF